MRLRVQRGVWACVSCVHFLFVAVCRVFVLLGLVGPICFVFWRSVDSKGCIPLDQAKYGAAGVGGCNPSVSESRHCLFNAETVGCALGIGAMWRVCLALYEEGAWLWHGYLYRCLYELCGLLTYLGAVARDVTQGIYASWVVPMCSLSAAGVAIARGSGACVIAQGSRM